MKIKKKFKGWAVIKSKTGSDWGDYDKWIIISEIVKTRKEAIKIMDDICSGKETMLMPDGFRVIKYDCLPVMTIKIYK